VKAVRTVIAATEEVIFRREGLAVARVDWFFIFNVFGLRFGRGFYEKMAEDLSQKWRGEGFLWLSDAGIGSLGLCCQGILG
jgi:hypothetical protein